MFRIGPRPNLEVEGPMRHINPTTNYIENCSLPKRFYSFPSEMTKMPLRDLSYASVKCT